MSKYEYPSSRGGADREGLFEQIDTDGDGVIDRDELASYVGGSGTKRTGVYGSTSRGRGGRLYDSSIYSAGYGLEGTGRVGSYQVSTYESTGVLDAAAIQQAASYTAESNAAWCRYGAEVRGVGLYVDPHPEIIRREIGGGVQTYTQNIRVRFLQPPPVATSGTLIIKEVRAAQPPPLPPLRIKQQQEVSVAQLPPLILRERPPRPPPVLPSETQIRHLPALPVPPRSVIIERYPAPPAPPRDIIIERWLPYNVVGERKTIVQRAEEHISYPAPHNVIIEYQQPSVRVVRQFQQLGVTQEDPQAYIARYGHQLLDSHTLVHEARAAGVLEDISVPALTTNLKSLTYSSDSALNLVGGETSIITGTSGLVGTGYEGSYVREVGVNEGFGGGVTSSTYESSSTSYSTGGGGLTSTGFSSTEAKL